MLPAGLLLLLGAVGLLLLLGAAGLLLLLGPAGLLLLLGAAGLLGAASMRKLASGSDWCRGSATELAVLRNTP